MMKRRREPPVRLGMAALITVLHYCAPWALLCWCWSPFLQLHHTFALSWASALSGVKGPNFIPAKPGSAAASSSSSSSSSSVPKPASCSSVGSKVIVPAYAELTQSLRAVYASLRGSKNGYTPNSEGPARPLT